MIDKKLGIILSGIIILGLNISTALAINPDSEANPQYLLNAGYSPEAIRIINLQKAQVLGTPSDQPKTDKHQSFIYNFFKYNDPVTPIQDFGTYIITDH